jgi:tetratricopeptide (TPR) repeat protein
LQQRYEEAAGASRRGLELAEDLPFSEDLTRRLREQVRLVEQTQAARDLHRFVERVRVLHGTEVPDPADAGVVVAHCADFWQQRERILARLGPQPGAELEQQVRTDLLELAVLWTELRVSLDASERGRALAVLTDAEALFGPHCVLALERRSLAEALGLADTARDAARQAAALVPRTAWEHYAVGRALLRQGQLAEAAAALERAVRLEPQSFWPWFYQGKCAYQRGRYDEAVAAFTACVALAPDRAWCYYNRALAYTELGRAAPALADYDRALQLDPTLAPAARNRARLRDGRRPER